MPKIKQRCKVNIKLAIDFANGKLTQFQTPMSFQTLADSIGEDRKLLYNYQHGLCRPDTDILLKISKKTGMPICEFVPIQIEGL